jgi:hypothetical protein
LLIGEHDPPKAARRGLQLLNQRRDAIVKHLRCPLFWCGPASFLTLTWECAPDFWSIRSVDQRLLPDPESPEATKHHGQAMREESGMRAMRWVLSARAGSARPVVRMERSRSRRRPDRSVRRASVAKPRSRAGGDDGARLPRSSSRSPGRPPVAAHACCAFMADLSQDPAKATSFTTRFEFARADNDLR